MPAHRRGPSLMATAVTRPHIPRFISVGSYVSDLTSLDLFQWVHMFQTSHPSIHFSGFICFRPHIPRFISVGSYVSDLTSLDLFQWVHTFQTSHPSIYFSGFICFRPHIPRFISVGSYVSDLTSLDLFQWDHIICLSESCNDNSRIRVCTQITRGEFQRFQGSLNQ